MEVEGTRATQTPFPRSKYYVHVVYYSISSLSRSLDPNSNPFDTCKLQEAKIAGLRFGLPVKDGQPRESIEKRLQRINDLQKGLISGCPI